MKYVLGRQYERRRRRAIRVYRLRRNYLEMTGIGIQAIASFSISIKIGTIAFSCVCVHIYVLIRPNAFPTTPDRQHGVKQGFLDRYGFPGVLGAIDCTHIRLRAPAMNSAVYVNRKGNHSINVQVVCDAFNNIINVCANFPGSSHDTYILDNSVMPTIFGRDPPLGPTTGLDIRYRRTQFVSSLPSSFWSAAKRNVLLR